MPEVSVSLAAYSVGRLVEHGIDVRLNTRLESVVNCHVMLSDGDEFDVNGTPIHSPRPRARTTTVSIATTNRSGPTMEIAFLRL